MNDKPFKPMTRVGYDRIAAEHDQLWEVERPKVVAGVAIAAAEGDRSENAEYIYGKKRLREIDKKLRQLSQLLTDVTLIDPENVRSDTVDFGCTVTILEGENERTWAIVGVGEEDVSAGRISWKSPLAQALWGKKVGAVIDFRRPAGEVEVEILKIEYKKLG
jgi:transcription elongation factor GreB